MSPIRKKKKLKDERECSTKIGLINIFIIIFIEFYEIKNLSTMPNLKLNCFSIFKSYFFTQFKIFV